MHRSWAILPFVAFLLVPDAPEGAAPPARPPGHQRMVALLAEIARSTSPLYPVPAQAPATLTARIAEADAAGPAEPRVMLRVSLAELRLQLGRTRSAIELLAEAAARVPDLPPEKQRVYRALVTFHQGVAFLRLGETENCVLSTTGEACILPFSPRAIHIKKEGSRKAFACFLKLAQGSPEGTPLHVAARWLLNVAAMTLGEYPGGVPEPLRIDPARFTSQAPFPRFHNLAPRLGLATVSLAGGVVVDDLDGDGLLDIMTSSWDPSAPLRLFQNQGDGTFRDRTHEAGLDGITGGLNLVQADYDNDGDVDVLVLRGAWLGHGGRHPNSLLRNDGDFKFTDVTFDAGLGEVHYPTQTAAWADYDRDGDLDLYLGNEAAGRDAFPCQLFRNDGNGRFTDVAAQAGVENLRWTKGVAWGDYDGDGWPDLYVSNFQGENRLYRNQGDGSFEDVAPRLGVTGPISSFPTWFWDFDNDGSLDILVNGYQMPFGSGLPDVWYVAASFLGLPQPAEPPRLYKGDGRGGFSDVAVPMGLDRVTLPMGANFGDLDGDGFLDFYLGTGYPGYEGLMPNVMYRNDRGRRFVDVTFAGGFGHLQKGHGIAFADIDNDGDQDVFEEMGGFSPGDAFGDALYENPGFGSRWITLQLVGTHSNRSAIGARIRVTIDEDGVRRDVLRWVGSGGSFGASPLRQEIGLGKADRIESLEVTWPATQARQVFHDVPLDAFLRLTEGQETFERLPARSFRLTGK